MSVIETALTRLLQIKHPILLAPMGSASGGRLAAAVTHAGGLGIIGSGYADSAAIKKELTAAGNARVGIGLVTWALDERPEALDTALAAHPPVLMLSFGSPMPFADAIKRAGCLLMCQVQTLAQAKEAAVSGADIIIAQGRDAGGHAGMTRGTMGLVPADCGRSRPHPCCRRWRNFRRARTCSRPGFGRRWGTDGHALCGVRRVTLERRHEGPADRGLRR